MNDGEESKNDIAIGFQQRSLLLPGIWILRYEIVEFADLDWSRRVLNWNEFNGMTSRLSQSGGEEQKIEL